MNGPPPASSADLGAIARGFGRVAFEPLKHACRVAIDERDPERSSMEVSVASIESTALTGEARTPTARSVANDPESVTGKRLTGADDAVEAAVRRAHAFTNEQLEAFGEACKQSAWCAVDRLSGDEVRRSLSNLQPPTRSEATD